MLGDEDGESAACQRMLLGVFLGVFLFAFGRGQAKAAGLA